MNNVRIYLRLLLIFTFSFCFLSNPLLSQDLQSNLKKYNAYRNRFFQEFIFADSLNRQGSNLPASRKYMEGNKTILKWGDCTIHHSVYIATLASEYQLLKLYAQDYQPTLKLLSQALLALERLDYTAEYWWRNQGGQLLGDLNGFFIRDDVETEQGENRFLDYAQPPAFVTDIDILKSDFHNDTRFLQEGQPDEMSQDQVWHLFLGLALAAKLVDEPDFKFKSVSLGEITIKQWIAEFVTKVLYVLSENELWEIRNPETGLPVRRGAAINEELCLEGLPLCINVYRDFAFASAAEYIVKTAGKKKVSFHKHGSATHKDAFYSTANLTLNFLPQSIYSFASLIAIIDAPGVNENLDSLSSYNWLLQVNRKLGYYEHFRLFYHLLHPKEISQDLQDDKDGVYGNLLNVAQLCGNFNVGAAFSVKEWSSINRLTDPERLIKGTGSYEVISGIYNGLDYLLLHNLYWLTYYNPKQGKAASVPFTLTKHDSPSCDPIRDLYKKIVSVELGATLKPSKVFVVANHQQHSITVGNQNQDPVSVEIFDVLGRCTNRVTVHPNTREQIQLQLASKNLYIVRIKGKRYFKTIKLLNLHNPGI